MSWGEVVVVGFVSLAAMVYASLRFAERAQRLAHKPAVPKGGMKALLAEREMVQKWIDVSHKAAPWSGEEERKKLRARLEKLTLAIARLEEHDERNQR